MAQPTTTTVSATNTGVMLLSPTDRKQLPTDETMRAYLLRDLIEKHIKGYDYRPVSTTTVHYYDAFNGMHNVDPVDPTTASIEIIEAENVESMLLAHHY